MNTKEFIETIFSKYRIISKINELMLKENIIKIPVSVIKELITNNELITDTLFNYFVLVYCIDVGSFEGFENHVFVLSDYLKPLSSLRNKKCIFVANDKNLFNEIANGNIIYDDMNCNYSSIKRGYLVKLIEQITSYTTTYQISYTTAYQTKDQTTYKTTYHTKDLNIDEKTLLKNLNIQLECVKNPRKINETVIVNNASYIANFKYEDFNKSHNNLIKKYYNFYVLGKIVNTDNKKNTVVYIEGLDSCGKDFYANKLISKGEFLNIKYNIIEKINFPIIDGLYGNEISTFLQTGYKTNDIEEYFLQNRLFYLNDIKANKIYKNNTLTIYIRGGISYLAYKLYRTNILDKDEVEKERNLLEGIHLVFFKNKYEKNDKSDIYDNISEIEFNKILSCFNKVFDAMKLEFTINNNEDNFSYVYIE